MYLKCHYRDVDRNAYVLTIILKNDGFSIDKAPIGFRSDVFVTMSREKLDGIVNWFFTKNWFTEGEAPDDDSLKVVWLGN